MTTRLAKRPLRALVLLLSFALVPAALGQTTLPGPDDEVETKKRAQTGFKFLSTSVSPRITALGGAAIADFGGSSASLFYNPASMAGMGPTTHAFAANTQFIADITYNAAGIAARPGGGNYGVVGVSFVNVDYGTFEETVRAANDQGYLDLGTYSPKAFALGLGYARTFTDRFAAGLHVKYASQNLGTFVTDRSAQGGVSLSDGTSALEQAYDNSVLVFDFGVVYQTGFRSLSIGMAARNFARELSYVRERFELPLTFQIGVSMDMIDLTSIDPGDHSLMLRVDAQRPRDVAEHLKLGIEYTLMDIISLRAGYAQVGVGSKEQQGASLGAGLNFDLSGVDLGADYSYTEFGVFGAVNRIGVDVGF